MLPAFLRNHFRALINRDWLNDTCTIEAQTNTVDSLGAPTPGWSTVASGVPCRVITANGGLRAESELVARRESLIETCRIILPAKDSTYAWELTISQRITISATGRVYHVIGILDDRADETDRQVIATRER
jgi:hypothetical protein